MKSTVGVNLDSKVLVEVDERRVISRSRLIQQLLEAWLRNPNIITATVAPQEQPIPNYRSELRSKIFKQLRETD